MSESTTTIQITKETRNALAELGSMRDDYNSIIERLITEHNRNNLVEYSRRIVTDRRKEFVRLDDL